MNTYRFSYQGNRVILYQNGARRYTFSPDTLIDPEPPTNDHPLMYGFLDSDLPAIRAAWTRAYRRHQRAMALPVIDVDMMRAKRC